jgi:phosphomannomutase
MWTPRPSAGRPCGWRLIAAMAWARSIPGRSWSNGLVARSSHSSTNPRDALSAIPSLFRRTLGRLREEIARHGCDIGFAQDPDGDRLAVLDETGRPVGEEITVALAVRAVLAHHEKGPVAANLSSGKSVEDVAHSFGCEITRTKTGEIHVSETMLKIGAVVGGEHTGGIIIPAVHPCRDSYGGMAVILEMMALTGRSISDLCAEIPRYCLMKDKLSIGAQHAPGILRRLRREYEGHPMNYLDGLYIDFGDRWVHVRRSNTEPVLRIIAEAPTAEGSAALIAEVRAKAEQGMIEAG